jgi:hypothetical protein
MMMAKRVSAIFLWISLAAFGAQTDRDLAVRRGIAFINTIASNPAYLADDSSDLLWCFYSFSVTSEDPEVRKVTGRMARELAGKWLEFHPSLPPNAGPNDLVNFATGTYAVAHLGLGTGTLIQQMRRRAPEIPVRDYYGFDPEHEPPPAGPDRYDLWCDALITAQAGEIAGVKLGATLPEVLQWLPSMRPYPARAKDHRFYSTAYSITHLIYMINNYSVYAVDRECLLPEFEYLRDNLPHVIAMNDPETLGEFLDTLRAFGLTDQDPEIQRGVEFLLATQNADGSWGDPTSPDIYYRFHSTWTAVDGLREYRFLAAEGCMGSAMTGPALK